MLLVAIYSMEYWQITESHVGVFNIPLAGISVCYTLPLCKRETVYREIFDQEMCWVHKQELYAPICYFLMALLSTAYPTCEDQSLFQ